MANLKETLAAIQMALAQMASGTARSPETMRAAQGALQFAQNNAAQLMQEEAAKAAEEAEKKGEIKDIAGMFAGDTVAGLIAGEGLTWENVANDVRTAGLTAVNPVAGLSEKASKVIANTVDRFTPTTEPLKPSQIPMGLPAPKPTPQPSSMQGIIPRAVPAQSNGLTQEQTYGQNVQELVTGQAQPIQQQAVASYRQPLLVSQLLNAQAAASPVYAASSEDEEEELRKPQANPTGGLFPTPGGLVGGLINYFPNRVPAEAGKKPEPRTVRPLTEADIARREASQDPIPTSVAEAIQIQGPPDLRTFNPYENFDFVRKNLLNIPADVEVGKTFSDEELQILIDDMDKLGMYGGDLREASVSDALKETPSVNEMPTTQTPITQTPIAQMPQPMDYEAIIPERITQSQATVDFAEQLRQAASLAESFNSYLGVPSSEEQPQEQEEKEDTRTTGQRVADFILGGKEEKPEQRSIDRLFSALESRQDREKAARKAVAKVKTPFGLDPQTASAIREEAVQNVIGDSEDMKTQIEIMKLGLEKDKMQMEKEMHTEDIESREAIATADRSNRMLSSLFSAISNRENLMAELSAKEDLQQQTMDFNVRMEVLRNEAALAQQRISEAGADSRLQAQLGNQLRIARMRQKAEADKMTKALSDAIGVNPTEIEDLATTLSLYTPEQLKVLYENSDEKGKRKIEVALEFSKMSFEGPVADATGRPTDENDFTDIVSQSIGQPAPTVYPNPNVVKRELGR